MQGLIRVPRKSDAYSLWEAIGSSLGEDWNGGVRQKAIEACTAIEAGERVVPAGAVTRKKEKGRMVAAWRCRLVLYDSKEAG